MLPDPDSFLIDLKKRFDACESDAKIVRGVWDELERYVVPFRGEMFKTQAGESSVEWDKYDHYDDTAVISAQTLAASVHGAILPPMRWFNFRFREDELQNDSEISEWLADTTRIVYHAIDNSNFVMEADELLLDLTGFGHGFMISETGNGIEEGSLTYTMVSLKEAFFEEGDKGEPRFFFRKLEWTATKLVSKFGYENCPVKIQKSYDNASSGSDMKFIVIFAIYPRDDKKNKDTTKPLHPKERPWGHCYFIHTSVEKIGEEGGYYDMPVYSVRWRKTSGSQWGHSPGHICLGDIKQLNQHRLMRTRAVEKAIDPANLVTKRGLLSKLDLGPRGLTVVKSLDDIAVYEGKANFAVSREELELLRQSIRQAFMVDQLELKDSPAMTAEEVRTRYELMNRLLGPTAGRLKSDWLDRIITNAYNIEQRAGRLPPAPEKLTNYEEANGEAEVGIEYIGALATSQKRQAAGDMVNWASQVAQLSEAFPDMKHVVNAVELATQVARYNSIPEKAINGKDEIEKNMQEEKKIIAEQQRIQEEQLRGDAMKAQGEGERAIRDAQNA